MRLRTIMKSTMRFRPLRKQASRLYNGAMRVARIALLSFAFVGPLFASAQSLNPATIGVSGVSVPALTLTLSPSNPRPGSVVVVTPESTVLNLSNSTVSISVNGTKVYSGNSQPVSVQVGANGTATTIRAVATTNGATNSASITLRPGDVSLVAEPISSAPALYLGKPLVPSGGVVRLVAIADLRTSSGKEISPANLSYVWQEDGSTLESASGIGRSTVVVSSPLPYRSSTITATVSSPDGSIVGQDDVTLSPQSPTLRLYIDDPLLGIIYDRALAGSQQITSSEVTIAAAPYSFPTDTAAPQVNWFLNGNAAQTSPTITLRPTGQGAGSATLSASVTSSDALANVSAALTLLFGQSTSNFLGL